MNPFHTDPDRWKKRLHPSFSHDPRNEHLEHAIVGDEGGNLQYSLGAVFHPIPSSPGSKFELGEEDDLEEDMVPENTRFSTTVSPAYGDIKPSLIVPQAEHQQGVIFSPS